MPRLPKISRQPPVMDPSWFGVPPSVAIRSRCNLSHCGLDGDGRKCCASPAGSSRALARPNA
eukprot:8152923-Alexandrium_andersonii.AAC.1